MQNFISTETSSQTAMACEQAALFGATPGRDEFDNREIWNEEEALAGIEEAIHILAGAVALKTARSSPTNARASSGVSSIRCTPKFNVSTAASTRSPQK